MSENRNALPEGYQLHWYRIRSVLGQGGFGITYLAEDINLNQQVAIKEFLPVELALRDKDASIQPITGESGEQYRWGLDRFINEAQTLALFKHPHIVRVFTVFSANNSAYMIMEYEHGVPLSERLKGQKSLPQAELESMAFPIMDGLQAVHARGFIHRDIKPANIFIRADGTPVLLDFGSARQALGEMTRTLTAMVSPGFAPFEQYTARGEKQGPWTDIYGLGATMYRAAVGKSPPNAMDRSEALLHTGKDLLVPVGEFAPPGYAPAFLTAIDQALKFRPEDRPQTVAQWRQEFRGRRDSEAPTAQSVAAPGTGDTIRITLTPPAPEADAEINPPPRSRRPWFVALAAIALLLVVIGIARRASPPPPVLPPAAVPAGTAAEPAAQLTTSAPLSAVTGAAVPDVTPPETVPKAVEKTARTVRRAAARPAPPAAEAESPSAGGANVEPPALLDAEERSRLVELQRRLQRKPRDQKTRAEIGALLERLNGRVREAIQTQDYPRAEAYINELLLLSPDNPRLREALAAIREKQLHTRNPGP